MADANASKNMDDEINSSSNLSKAEMAENALGDLTRQPYLSLSPLDKRYPHTDSDGDERRPPPGSTSTGLQGVPNPERGRIPPTSDPNMRPPNTHPDDVAGAGAAALDAPVNTVPLSGDNVGPTNTQALEGGWQDLFPPQSTGLKASREVKGLGTTNHPGYSEAPINPNAQRVRKLGLEQYKARHLIILEQFDDALSSSKD